LSLTELSLTFVYHLFDIFENSIEDAQKSFILIINRVNDIFLMNTIK